MGSSQVEGLLPPFRDQLASGVATVTAFLTVGFSEALVPLWDGIVRHEKELQQRLEHIHLNPVRKGSVKRPKDWRWSSYNNFALDKATVAACPIRIDYVWLREGYGGEKKPTVRKPLTVASRSLQPELRDPLRAPGVLKDYMIYDFP